MKRPYYNLQQRLLIRLETLQGACMEFNIARLRLCRDIERSTKRSKFLLFIFSVVKEKRTFSYCQREIEGNNMCKDQCDHCKEYYAPLESNK